MNLQRLLSGDPSRSSMLYLGIGVISLLKAIAVRDDSTRFRRELLDAGLFIGVGLVLRRYGKLREQKRAELEQQLPSWLVEPSDSSGSVRTMAKQRLGDSEPAREPSLGERARAMLSSG